MNIKNTTFIQKHIEKLALGMAGAFLLVVTAYYLFSIPAKPFGVKLSVAHNAKTPIQNIGDVPKILEEKAIELGSKLRRESTVDPAMYQPSNYPQIMTDLRRASVVTGVQLPLLGDYPMSSKDITGAPVNPKPYFMPRPMLPQDIKAVTGHVVLASGDDRSYVSVEASFDMNAWRSQLLDKAQKHGSGQDVLTSRMADQGLFVTGVYLEREQWDPEKGAFGGRTRILSDPHACYLESEPVWNANEEKDKADALIKSIKDNQAQIQRPSFPPLDAQSPLPLLREVPAEVSSEDKGSAQVSDRKKEEDAAPRPLRLWAHDLTAESGRKYRYRLVATVLNPLYSIPASSLDKAQAAESATKVALAPVPQDIEKSPWTEIFIPADFHCFFIDASNTKARLEVWKVVSARWVGQVFEVQEGDAIGSRQAMVTFPGGDVRPVDLDSQKVLVDILDKPDPQAPDHKIKAVLLMNADGSLETRYASIDVNSPERKEVQKQSSEAPAEPAADPVVGDKR